MKWTLMLPIALLRIRSTPTKRTNLSPFEVLYGRPPPIIRGIRGDLHQIGGVVNRELIQKLGESMQDIGKWVQEKLPISLSNPVHPFKPGDTVWVKEWNLTPLGPKWRGPYTVLLSTPTAIRVAEVTPWIHHSRVKRAADLTDSGHSTLDPQDPLRLRLTREIRRKNSSPVFSTPLEAAEFTHGRR